MKAIDLGGPISVPVGHGTLGRVINVIGEPVDQLGPIEFKERLPIHRPAPAFDEQATTAEMFETGVKVIDLIQPFLKGGKIGLFGGAGVGKTVVIMSVADQNGGCRLAGKKDWARLLQILESELHHRSIAAEK